MQHPGVPGSLAGSGDTKQGRELELPLVSPGSVAALAASPAALGKSSGWLAVKDYLCPRLHRCDHRRQLAQPGGPR